MAIDPKNIEALLVDYLEGRLSKDEAKEIEYYLNQNPHLLEDIRDFNSLYLIPEEEKMIDKSYLKKDLKDFEINYSNFEEFCIAKVEKDLNDSDNERFKKFLNNNPQLKKDFEIYKKVFLKSDKSIFFPLKSELKHIDSIKKNTVYNLYYSLSLAASVVLIIGLFFFFKNKKVYDSSVLNNSFVEVKKEFPKQNKILNYPISSPKKTEQFTSKSIPYNKNIKEDNKKNEVILLLGYQKPREIKNIANVQNSLKPIIPHEYILNKISSPENNEKTLTINKLYALIDKGVHILNFQKKIFSGEEEINVDAIKETGINELNKIISPIITFYSIEDTVNNRKKIIIESGLLGFYKSKSIDE